MTDLVQDALRIFDLSAKFNGFVRENDGDDEPLRTRVMNWNKFREDKSIRRGEFDIVLASDVLFGSWCVAPVCDAVTFALRENGVLLLSDPCRLQEGGLVEKLKESGAFHEVHLLEFPERTIETILRAGFEHHRHDAVGEVEDAQERKQTREGYVKVFRAKLIVARRNSKELEVSMGDARDDDDAKRRTAPVLDLQELLRGLEERFGMMVVGG